MWTSTRKGIPDQDQQVQRPAGSGGSPRDSESIESLPLLSAPLTFQLYLPGLICVFCLSPSHRLLCKTEILMSY